MCCLVAHANPPSARDSTEARVSEVGLAFNLPRGWREVPASTLDALTADLRARAPTAAIKRSITGYQPAEYPSDRLTFPYVLVQEQASRPPTPEELRAAVVQMNSPEGARAVTQKSEGLLTEAVSQLAYDEATTTVNGTMLVEIDGNKLVAYTRIMVTSKGTVSLIGYYQAADRAAATKFFRPIFDTARLDASAQPSTKGTSVWWQGFDWVKVGTMMVTGMALGLLGTTRKKKEQPAPSPSVRPPPTGARMLCTECGAEIQSDARFCGKCGRRLQQESLTPSRTEQRSLPPLVRRQEAVQPLSANESICSKCGTRFVAEPKGTFLGFKNFVCPKCFTTTTHPLSSKVRAFYVGIFALGLVVLWYALTHGYEVTGPSFIGCAIVFALIKDVYVRWRVSRTAAAFPNGPTG